jgi:hypothetical protein
MKLKSKYLLIIIALIYSYVGVTEKRWQQNKIIEWDVYGYTLYLSATLIYNDVTELKFHEAIFEKYRPTNGTPSKTFAFHEINNKRVIKYTMGNGIMHAPLYIGAHLYYKLFNASKADGYTPLYRLSIIFTNILLYIFGLCFLIKFLTNYLKLIYIHFAILAVSFGTNIFFYATIEPGYAHIALFFCYSAIIYFFNLWLQKQTKKPLIFAALFFGLLVLIRPTDIILGLLLATWYILNFYKTINWLNTFKQAAFFVGIAAMVFMPQIIYWKATAGNYFFDSYQGEAFNFLNPHIFDGLFSYRKGLFVYTPLAILLPIGIVFIYKKIKGFVLATTLFMAVGVYITLSWIEWWYGGNFGMRAFMQWYGLLIIAIAALIQSVKNYTGKFQPYLKWFLYQFIFCCVLLNLFQSWQYKVGFIHWDQMNKQKYWSIFGRHKLSWQEKVAIYGFGW